MKGLSAVSTTTRPEVIVRAAKAGSAEVARKEAIVRAAKAGSAEVVLKADSAAKAVTVVTTAKAMEKIISKS